MNVFDDVIGAREANARTVGEVDDCIGPVGSSTRPIIEIEQDDSTGKGGKTVLEKSPYNETRPATFLTIALTIAAFAVASLWLSFSTATPLGGATVSASSPPAALFGPVGAGTASVLQTSGPSFDICIRQNSEPRITFCFNSSTGDYRLTDCGKNLTLTGKGTVTNTSCKKELKHSGPDPKKPDRNVSALANPCTKAGSASVSIFATGASYTISDSDITNNDLAAPTVGVTSPNGGETLIVGLQTIIRWTSGDNVAVTSQDILFSTNGGASFTPIATGLAASINQLSWAPPSMPDTTAGKIRVVARDAACNTASDDSNAAFTILNDVSAPEVTLLGPNGGEIVYVGATYRITWITSDNVGVASHDVLVSTNGGTSFSTVAQGLPGGARHFQWTAPTIPNNQTVRVQVKARDLVGNVGQDNSDSNLTIWNPAAAYTHVAEAPIYITSGGFNSTIYLCNTSASPATVEFGFRQPFGNATAKPPMTLTLAGGEARTINVLEGLTVGAPLSPSDPNIVMGGIYLRHDGGSDDAVKAMIAVDRSRRDQSFVTPFVYPASAQSASGGGECAPLFYLDDATSAYLALQNCINEPVSVTVKVNYGTGPSTPSGTFELPPLTLAGQQTIITNLAAFADLMQGQKWGSIHVKAPARTVVAHTVVMSFPNHLAFDTPFVDPSTLGSTTKVGSTLKLDSTTDLKGCVMVCNLSTTESRVVTASFNTDNGVTLPSTQFTLLPGKQQLIELQAHPGQSTMADVRISHDGSPGDVVAGAVSMSIADNRAIPARFVESSPDDGPRLVSPFFKIDARTSGIAQVTNIGASPVKAGFKMKLANLSLGPLTTDLISIPAGGTATLDLQKYLNQMPDEAATQGCIELVHNGTPGSVCGTFTASGNGTDISQATTFEPAPASPCGVVVFPNAATLESGESTQLSVITSGCSGGVSWSSSFGTIAPLPSSEPGIEHAEWTPPGEPDDPETLTIEVASASGSGTATITLQKVKLQEFVTLDANGNPRVDGQGNFVRRLNLEGATRFRLTSNKPFTAGTLTVAFRVPGLEDLLASNVSLVAENQLEGDAPSQPEPLFIGDVGQIIVFLIREDGTRKKVSKDRTSGAYYAFDPPSPDMMVTPNALDRAGGDITITGSGFKKFQPQTGATVSPEVDIAGIPVKDPLVNQPGTQITGTLRNAPRDLPACGANPCLPVRVINPGGKKSDRVESGPVFRLLRGPAPVGDTVRPPGDLSSGGAQVTITGSNFFVVEQVKIGLAPALPTCPDLSCWTRSAITVIAPPNCTGPKDVRLLDVDDLVAGGSLVSGGGFIYSLSPITLKEGDEDLDGRVETLFLANRTLRAVYRVGPRACESLTANPANISGGMMNCLTATVRSTFSAIDSSEARAAFLVEVEIDSGNCTTQEDVNFQFNLVNGTVTKPVRMTLRLR